MEIIINEKTYGFATVPTLSEMLLHLGIKSPAGIAIAVNDCIIQKSLWSEYFLNDKDNITVIKATQGG